MSAVATAAEERAAPTEPAALIDAFGRRLDYLRISVTDRCNLRCQYCMPADAEFPYGDRRFLAPDELETMVRAFVSLGISRLRITGGEPLVRKDVLEIARRVARIPGVEDLALSTNGMLLESMAPALRAAGIRRVNVSLDSLDPETFLAVTRRGDMERVWRGVRAALEAGFDPVKLNMVLLAGINEADIDRMVELTRRLPLSVRFIELMATPANEELTARGFLSAVAARSSIEARFGRLMPASEKIGNGPARVFQIPGFLGTLGFISPMSHSFCSTCSRLRLTARGEARLCLFAERDYPLRHLLSTDHPEEALRRRILELMRVKPEQHRLHEGSSGNLQSFVQIGG